MIVTVCRLTLHDFLFYASREMGRIYETEKYLHNYGLTYALGLAKAPFANLTQAPRYQADLEQVNDQRVYVTPAYPLHYAFAFHTFKMANVNYYNFTPQISTNQVVFGRAKELAPESSFTFFVLSEHEVRLPSWIRLGKWMAKARVNILARERAHIKEGSYQATGALNPLDVAMTPENCNIVSMAPASLITHAYYTGHYYEISLPSEQRAERICLPIEMRYQPERSARLSA